MNGTTYTYNELQKNNNNKNVVYLVAAHPERGDFALLVVTTTESPDTNSIMGGSSNMGSVNGMARHHNEELVKVTQQQGDSGRSNEVVISKQERIEFPDWECGVRDNDHDDHSHVHKITR